MEICKEKSADIEFVTSALYYIGTGINDQPIKSTNILCIYYFLMIF